MSRAESLLLATLILAYIVGTFVREFSQSSRPVRECAPATEVTP